MDAQALFNNDLTPRHVLGAEETSELEAIANDVLQETDTSSLSVPGFENRGNREELRHAIFSANSSLNLDHRIERHYLPPQPYFDLGGSELREGKNHPLSVFQQIGLFTNEQLLQYKLVMGQLIESVERMAMKGYDIMGKQSSASFLCNVPEDTPDEARRLNVMRESKEGRVLLEEQGVSAYHSVLIYLHDHLGTFPAKLEAVFSKSRDGVSKAWGEFREDAQQRSDEGFARFMSDYQDDLEKATECMKLAYAMTKEMLSTVSKREAYRSIPATADMALHPIEYQRDVKAGIRHLKMVDEVLSSYVVEQPVFH